MMVEQFVPFFDFGDETSSIWIPLSVVTRKYAEEGKHNPTLFVMDEFGARAISLVPDSVLQSSL